MSILKSRGAQGRRQVFAYDPAVGRKRYVDTVGPCSGSGNARTCKCAECKQGRKIEAEGAERFADRRIVPVTVAQWRTAWLEGMHGKGTSRPSSTTHRHNLERTRAFAAEFGERKLASISDDEASDFALEHPGRLKAVKAMFADAERRGRIALDPFRHVKPPKSNGREDITPLTEAELARLVEIASGQGAYGQELAALIAFAGWTGLRPGEICGLEWPEVDLRERVLHVEWQRRKDGARVRTKTKVNRVVPLEDVALDALRRVGQRQGSVFRSMTSRELRPETLGLYWQDVRDKFTTELPMGHWLVRRLRHDPTDRLTVYECRHFFGSLLGDRGLSARDIALVMGNSPAVCERVYVHPHQSRVQDRVRAALRAAASDGDGAAMGCWNGTQAVGERDAG
jgi:integrase